MRFGQEDLLAPYLEKYLEAADTIWERLGTHKASTVLEYMFPKPLASPTLLDKVDAWLESSEANPAAKRYVREGRDDIARALAAQERDARKHSRVGDDRRPLAHRGWRTPRDSCACRVCGARACSASMAMPALEAADEVAAAKARLHLQHGQPDLAVGERAAHLGAGHDLDGMGDGVDQHAACCASARPARRGAGGVVARARRRRGRRRPRTRSDWSARQRGSPGRSRTARPR